MNVGLFFGSFNPIHLGHTRLAEYLLHHTCLEQIWLVVSPNNPLKDPATLLPEEVRFRLAQAAVRDIPGLVASDYEFRLPKPSYTANTLRALTADYPEHAFTLIMGSDNMANFHRWREADYILEHYPIMVYPREGDDLLALRKRYPQMQVVQAPLLPVSATAIRHKIAAGQPVGEWLHPEVEAYMKNQIPLH